VAPKKAIVKTDVKSKVAAKKCLDCRLMAKNLRTKIQVSLVPNHGEGSTNSPELPLLNFYHQPTITAISWAPPCIFFHNDFLGGPTIFFSLTVLD